MKKNLLVIAITCLGISTVANAETNLNSSSEKLLPNATKPYSINKVNDSEKKLGHVAKLNLSQLALKNISLQYELAFHKNLSVALGYSNFMKREIPSQIFSNNKADGYKLPYMKGWAITPEFRFYPGKKEENPAPKGFYLAPYMRYSKYTLGADYVMVDNTTLITHKYQVTGSYKGSSFGLMLGNQWIFGKHFSFDWWIMGAGSGKGKLVLEMKDATTSLTASQQEKLKEDVDKNIGELGRFGKGALLIETTSNSATATISGVPMLSLRGMVVAGLNFGFKF